MRMDTSASSGNRASPAGRWARQPRSALMPDRLRDRVATLRLGSTTRRNIATSLIAPDFARRIDLRARLAALARHGVHDRSDVRLGAASTLDHPYVTVAVERYHRLGAAHGVQPRHPFTDRRLLELCVHLPDRQRFDRGWSKAVLRRAMAGPAARRRRLAHRQAAPGLVP